MYMVEDVHSLVSKFAVGLPSMTECVGANCLFGISILSDW